MPSGLTDIGVGAFRGCTGFTGELNLPSGLTLVSGFDGCTGFTGELNLPSGLTIIGDDAFRGCTGFTGELNLPSGLRAIDGGAFSGCTGFTGELVIPEGVTKMGVYRDEDDYHFFNQYGAFSGCTGFTSLRLPSGLKFIGVDAFSGCSGLEGELSLPDGLEMIGDDAFSGCSNLSGNLQLPESLTYLGSRVFSGCAFTGTLTLPESLTEIGGYAFGELWIDYAQETELEVGMKRQLRAYASAKLEMPVSWRSSDENVLTVDESGLVEAVGSGTAVITVWNADGWAKWAEITFQVTESETNPGTPSEPDPETPSNPDPETPSTPSPGTPSDPTPETPSQPNTEAPTQPNTEAPTQPNTEAPTQPSTEAPTQPNTEAPKKVSSITLQASDFLMKKGSTLQLVAKVRPTDAANRALLWSSSDTSVATVSESGKVTGKGYGTAVITATAADGSKTSAHCKITVGYGITYQMNGGTNSGENPSAYYQTSVKLGAPVRKGYVFKGWYSDKKFKKKVTKIDAKSQKDTTVYAKWEKVKVGKATVKSLKNTKGKKAVLKWKKTDKASGYEILYGTKKNAKGGSVITSKKTTVTLKKLKKGATYYVKVRAYRTDSAGNKVYGKYSSVQKIKVTK